jgi:carbonic anhydrase
MDAFHKILDSNKAWAARIRETDPEYFQRRMAQQQPHTLFVACSDSRIPTNALTGTEPGEMFVHRNIANQASADLNFLSVLHFAVEILDVNHIVVCGHYNCGGVSAALDDEDYGVVDHWLAGLRALRRRHHEELEAIPDHAGRVHRLVELNVLEQIHNLVINPTIMAAWERGNRPLIHGVVFDLSTGLLNEMVCGINTPELASAYTTEQ